MAQRDPKSFNLYFQAVRVFFCSVRFLLNTPFCNSRGWPSKKKTLWARYFFCSGRGWPSKTKFTPGAFFFFCSGRARSLTHLRAGGRVGLPSGVRFVFCSGRGWPSKKNTPRARFFFARDAPGHSLTCGPGVVWAFLQGCDFFVRDAAGRAKKTLRALFFFACSGRGWPSKKKEKEKSWPRVCFFVLGTRLAEQKEGKGKELGEQKKRFPSRLLTPNP